MTLDQAVASALNILQAGRPAEAEALCRRVLAADPAHANALAVLGLALRHQGRTAAAAATFRRAAALAPHLADRWLHLAQCLVALGRSEAACRALRRLLALQPNSLEGRIELARLLEKGDGHAEAAEHWLAAARLRPDLLEAWFFAGMESRHSGRMEQALACYAKALQLEPELHQALFNYGITLYDLDRLAPAETYLRRAARLDRHPVYLARLARVIMLRGRPAEALPLCEEAIAISAGRSFDPLCLRGEILEALGRTEEASEAYRLAIQCNEGFGLPATRRWCIALRRQWGDPGATPPEKAPGPGGRGLVTMRTLGQNGRFGNQLLQYGFLRAYAAEYGLDYQVPEWPGRYLFDLADPPVTERLPNAGADVEESLAHETARVYAGCDIAGFFCKSTRFMAAHKELFRTLFTPGRNLRPYIAPVRPRLAERGRTVVALHLRRGDYGYAQFWIAPEAWYLAWLERLWPLLDRPVLYIATDDPRTVEAFAAYRPMTMADLGPPVPGAEFYLDFFVLSQAQVVGISNSTFSFTATMLNRDGVLFYRPDRGKAALVPFDPWDSEALV